MIYEQSNATHSELWKGFIKLWARWGAKKICFANKKVWWCWWHDWLIRIVDESRRAPCLILCMCMFSLWNFHLKSCSLSSTIFYRVHPSSLIIHEILSILSVWKVRGICREYLIQLHVFSVNLTWDLRGKVQIPSVKLSNGLKFSFAIFKVSEYMRSKYHIFQVLQPTDRAALPQTIDSDYCYFSPYTAHTPQIWRERYF